MADLISGYAVGGQGVITLYLGNAGNIFPNMPESKARKDNIESSDSPLIPSGMVLPLPEPPDFLGTGDFDGDGHKDIIAAAKQSDHFYILRGDGRGEFAQAAPVDVGGNLTTMLVGDMNRRDGLEDVVVAVRNRSGSQVRVYESPRGALHAPRRHPSASGGHFDGARTTGRRVRDRPGYCFRKGNSHRSWPRPEACLSQNSS